MALMLTKTRMRAGVWEGELQGIAGEDVPRIEVVHLEQVLSGVNVAPARDGSGMWLVRVPVPADLLSDGVQTFVIRDAVSGEKLNGFTIVTGEVLEEDIRAEVDLLRAELDMLKRAFRRHCLETRA